MGGFGSGRRIYPGRKIVESCRSLDANRLNKAGCLKSGCHRVWQWEWDGERKSQISIRADEDHLSLSYKYRVDDGDWQHVEQVVPIIRIPCRFGGSRPYFICPGLGSGDTCGLRVLKLYNGGKYFLCRHCYGLAYASQKESGWERALRRGDKIRMRLGGKPGLGSEFPPRPKGMWNRTYQRLRQEALEVRMSGLRAILDEPL